MWRAAILVALIVVQSPSASVSAEDWAFKTPGEAAYCRFESGRLGGFLCMTPSDGFWIRLTGIYSGDAANVRKGSSDRFRGHRDPTARVLGFGRVFISSDAQAITCWSRRSGLTCKQIGGLSFWLGRHRGYRIFYDAPGFPPNVRPLFQTGHGIRCGINLDNLEPANPILDCWRPADGLLLGIAHDDAGRRGSHGRSEKAIGFRPTGFRVLPLDSTFVWRCREVTARYADGCSTRSGAPVFTCTSARARLTCVNRNEHGFWANARNFYTF